MLQGFACDSLGRPSGDGPIQVSLAQGHVCQGVWWRELLMWLDVGGIPTSTCTMGPGQLSGERFVRLHAGRCGHANACIGGSS